MTITAGGDSINLGSGKELSVYSKDVPGGVLHICVLRDHTGVKSVSSSYAPAGAERTAAHEDQPGVHDEAKSKSKASEETRRKAYDEADDEPAADTDDDTTADAQDVASEPSQKGPRRTRRA